MACDAQEFGLVCPVWVEFIDPKTRLPYFFNVVTLERRLVDPDPAGEERILGAEAAAEAAAEAEVAGSSLASLAWWERPARVQQAVDQKKVAYTEGHEMFNIWFGKYENDRYEPKEIEPAGKRCDPRLDCGWTEADLPGAQKSFFCIYFAMGRCNMGPRCQYYHRVPTAEDSEACEVIRDIFGRERFRDHRGDMGGVGSFNSACQTLFIGDLRFDRVKKDALQMVEVQLAEHFGVWGPIEQIRVIPTKGLGFVRYRHRAAAEFAKVAMENQSMGLSKVLRVRWSSDDPSQAGVKRRREEMEEAVDAAVGRKMAGWSEVELAGLQLANQPADSAGAIARYPDTSAQYPQAKTQPSVAAKKQTPGSLGPVTREDHENEAARVREEEERRAAKIEADANIDRMTAVLAKIDAMHGAGCFGAPDL